LIENTNVYVPATAEWLIYSANSGAYETWGFEGQVLFRPSKKIELDSRFILQKTIDLRDGYESIEVAYSPLLMGYFNASYRVLENFTIASNIRYIDKMQAAWETETTPENGERIGAESPANVLINLNLLYENLFHKNIYLGLKVGNLLGTDIRYPTTTSNTWIDKGALTTGRRFNLKLGIDF
jgi:hypothetical protein